MSNYYNVYSQQISVEEWSRSFTRNRCVGLHGIKSTRDPKIEISVSTVWLGLDHSFGGGPPLIFETMVFGLDSGNEPMDRYSTFSEAQVAHIKIVTDIVHSTRGRDLGLYVATEERDRLILPDRTKRLLRVRMT